MLTDIGSLADLTNIGTLFAFALVCSGVIVLRKKDPTRPRPFRVPFVPLFPILGVLFCFALMLSLPIETWIRFFIWLAIGLAIYFLYSVRHSRLRHGIDTGDTERGLASDRAVEADVSNRQAHRLPAIRAGASVLVLASYDRTLSFAIPSCRKSKSVAVIHRDRPLALRHPSRVYAAGTDQRLLVPREETEIVSQINRRRQILSGQRVWTSIYGRTWPFTMYQAAIQRGVFFAAGFLFHALSEPRSIADTLLIFASTHFSSYYLAKDALSSSSCRRNWVLSSSCSRLFSSSADPRSQRQKRPCRSSKA